MAGGGGVERARATKTGPSRNQAKGCGCMGTKYGKMVDCMICERMREVCGVSRTCRDNEFHLSGEDLRRVRELAHVYIQRGSAHEW